MQIQTKRKKPFKFDLGVLNFKELKVNCEITQKLSDFEVAAFAREYQLLEWHFQKLLFKIRFTPCA